MAKKHRAPMPKTVKRGAAARKRRGSTNPYGQAFHELRRKQKGSGK